MVFCRFMKSLKNNVDCGRVQSLEGFVPLLMQRSVYTSGSTSIKQTFSESYLVRVQSDPQSQFGHAVLLQQLQVWTQSHTERSRHVLREAAVVGRVAQNTGLVFALEEEHLRAAQKNNFIIRPADLKTDTYIFGVVCNM